MDSREKLIEIASRHAAHLERLKSHNVSEYVTFLEQMDDELRKMINGRKAIGEHIIPELEKKLAGVKSKLLAINDKIFDKFEDQAKVLARSEAAFEVKSLGQAIKKDFSLPTNAQISKAVFATPLAEIKGANGGALLKGFFKGTLEGQADNVLGQIRAGFFRGDTTRDISNRILGTVANGQNDGELAKTWRAINGAVRTGLQHSAVQARKETWANNKDIVKARRIVAVLDDRTADVDRALDGREFPLDSGPVPPFHVGCFPGYAEISPCSTVSKYYRRKYDGLIIRVKTESGAIMDVTPNHPVLTKEYGWLPADNLFKHGDVSLVSLGKIPSDDFEDLFDTSLMANNGVEDIASSELSFHGDITAGDIVTCVNVSAEAKHQTPSLPCDSDLPDYISRKPFKITFDKVKSVMVKDFCGYVYNLENEKNWYLANGFIVHNCRCTEIAVLDKRFAVLEQDGTRAARPDGGKITSIDAKKTYYGFLKDQPKEFIESVIGPTRAKLLLNGGLSAERFAELQLDRNFQPMTLEEMKKVEPLAFIRAGIE